VNWKQRCQSDSWLCGSRFQKVDLGRRLKFESRQTMRVPRGREYRKGRQKKPQTRLLGKLTMTSPHMGQLGDEDPAKEVKVVYEGRGAWRVCVEVFLEEGHDQLRF